MKTHKPDANTATFYRDRFLHFIWMEIVQSVYAFMGLQFVGWMALYNDKEMQVRIIKSTAVDFLEWKF